MDTLFFWCSKLFWLIISPDHLLVWMLSTALFFLLTKCYLPAKLLFSISISAIVLITFLPVGEILLEPLENRFPVQKKLPAHVDGIIVLGGAESIRLSKAWNQVELYASAERFFAFIQMINIYPKAKPIFAGGTGSLNQQQTKGATIAEHLFKNLGLDLSSIFFERESRNTYENAVNSYKLIQPMPNETWILITSAYHMPRSMGAFRNAGWNPIAYPVDHNALKNDVIRFEFNFSANLELLCKAVKEWVGLSAYYLTGKTRTFFPAPEARS